MKNTVLVFLPLAASFVFVANDANAQVKTRLKFPARASATSVKGTVRGYAYRDYVVRANADQTITASVSSPIGFTVLTIFRPDGENLDGAMQKSKFSGALPMTGDYVIRVGLMRARARRPRAVSNFTLKVSID